MPTMHMTKVPEYPLPHNFDYGFAMGMESAISATMCPIVTYSEALGVINSKKTNPQNASFAEVSTDKCYPTSKIHQVFAEFKFNLSKEFLETDKLHSLRFATMKIHTSFMDAQLAEDEVSGVDLNELLELQNEATNRSTFPIYSGTKMKQYKSNLLLDMPADQLGLTTDVEIETIVFSENTYYDALHYHTTAKKLTSIQDGLHFHTLTKNHPTKTIRVYQNEQTKYMNPYTLLALMILCPSIGGKSQYGKASDSTDVNHLEVTFKCRFNEWNHEFNHSLQ